MTADTAAMIAEITKCRRGGARIEYYTLDGRRPEIYMCPGDLIVICNVLYDYGNLTMDLPEFNMICIRSGAKRSEGSLKAALVTVPRRPWLNAVRSVGKKRMMWERMPWHWRSEGGVRRKRLRMTRRNC